MLGFHRLWEPTFAFTELGVLGFGSESRRHGSFNPHSNSGSRFDVAVRECLTDEHGFLPGNLYSIDNKWDRPARIFFAQGCETFDEDVSR